MDSLSSFATNTHSLSPGRLPLSPRALYSTSETLIFSSHLGRRNLNLRSSICFRTFFTPPIAGRTSAAPLNVAHTDRKTINGDEGRWNSLETLLTGYKKAVIDGDVAVVLEIEEAICAMDVKKNDLSQKFEEMQAEIASGKDSFLRLKADFENFRKRSDNDRITFKSDIQVEVIESLLPLVDSFEKAKQQLKVETEKEKKIVSSYQGIYKQFVDTLRSLRVAVVETVGKPFDPSIHEAVGREESPIFKDGIVTQELRRGFYLGERLLRPAAVKVSIGPGKVASSAKQTAEQSGEKAEGDVTN